MWKPLVASKNVGCFLRLSERYLIIKRTLVNHWSLPFVIIYCPSLWSGHVSELVKNLKYCKILKISPSTCISPSKYKPPRLVMQKTLGYIAPPNISPRGLVLGKLPSNTKWNKAKMVNLLPNKRLAHSILKRKFPSEYKPLKKGLWKI